MCYPTYKCVWAYHGKTQGRTISLSGIITWLTPDHGLTHYRRINSNSVIDWPTSPYLHQQSGAADDSHPVTTIWISGRITGWYRKSNILNREIKKIRRLSYRRLLGIWMRIFMTNTRFLDKKNRRENAYNAQKKTHALIMDRVSPD